MHLSFWRDLIIGTGTSLLARVWLVRCAGNLDSKKGIVRGVENWVLMFKLSSWGPKEAFHPVFDRGQLLKLLFLQDLSVVSRTPPNSLATTY